MTDEVSTIIEIAKLSPTTVLAVIAWKIWVQVREMAREFLRSQEQIKRAIIVSNPETARIFDEVPLTKR